jgi:integrase
MAATRTARSARDQKLVGARRTQGGGRKAWSATLHWPTEAYPYWRVVSKDNQNPAKEWRWRTWTATSEAAGRELFASAEKALNEETDLPAPKLVVAKRTVGKLMDDYLANADKHLEDGTAYTRALRVNKHIRPVLGGVNVRDWTPELSQQVLYEASATLRAASSFTNLKEDLSALLKLARHGGLAHSLDPLWEVRIPVLPDEAVGEGTGYVALNKRPSMGQVLAAVTAAGRFTRGEVPTEHGPMWKGAPLFDLLIRIGGLCGLRPAENLGLRPVDVDYSENLLDVNGGWIVPKKRPGQSAPPPPRRGPIKNKKRHWVAMPGTVQRALLPRCAVLLGLPEDATREQVIRAQEAERDRRAHLAVQHNIARAAEQKRRKEAKLPPLPAEKPMQWWTWAPATPTDEQWIFEDPHTGVPLTQGNEGILFREVLKQVKVDDPLNRWKPKQVFYNLRHHFCCWMHYEEGFSWAAVGDMVGDKAPTLERHYDRAGAADLKKAVAAVANH